jgi:hypothetical protein
MCKLKLVIYKLNTYNFDATNRWYTYIFFYLFWNDQLFLHFSSVL